MEPPPENNIALSDDQRFKINSITELGISNDQVVALNSLVECGWNMDIAKGLAEQFEKDRVTNKGIIPVGRNRSLGARAVSLDVEAGGKGDVIITQSFLQSVYDFIYNIVARIRHSVGKLFFRKKNMTVEEEIIDFRHLYVRKYSNLHPTFYLGTFSSASKRCIDDRMFLICYLHDFRNNHCNRTAKSFISDSGFNEFIKSHRVLFWACDVTTVEGKKVMLKLKVTEAPAIIVVAPVIYPPHIAPFQAPKMRAHGKIESKELYSLDDIKRKIQSFIAMGLPVERDFPVPYNESVQSFRKLRAEQDAEYRRCLAIDQKYEMQRQDELRRMHEENEREAQKLRMMQEKSKDLGQRKADAKAMLSNIDENTPDSIRVSFKFPDGQRQVQPFLPTDTIQALYYFVLSQEMVPAKFNLFHANPRKQVKCSPLDPKITMKDSGISNETLLVEWEADSSSLEDSSDYSDWEEEEEEEATETFLQ